MYIDITMTLSKDIPVFPNDTQFHIQEISQIKKGNVANVSFIEMGSHSATHIDAPKHFIDNGKSIDNIDLNLLIGTAKVFEIKNKNKISKEDLLNFDINENDIILLKTDNNDKLLNNEFYKDFVYIDNSAADYLVEKRIKAIGIDYLSIEYFYSKDYYVHKRLLSNNIIIIEGLLLHNVKQGVYKIYALPLKISNCDGAPARVILEDIV
ncbi:cyclase family protein [Caldicellulosiruptoraceae bacterium PP1]